MSRPTDVPDLVRQTALSYGAPGREWLDSLGTLTSELERAWGITIGRALSGGTASYVAEATTPDGASLVAKLAMPEFDGQGDLAHEIRTLTIADGRGCVRLIEHDEPRRALLVERLGRQLNDLALPVPRQLEIICETLQRLWCVAPADSELPSGAEKGRRLADFITRMWAELDEPCSVRVIDRALSFAEHRIAVFDIEQSVLVHGDAHGWNTLEDGAGGFKFVDPDGLIAEREYDLAIPMREFNDELRVGDALQIGRERCRLLSHLTGTDADAIWEWGFIERVSTFLLLIKEGHDQLAADFGHVAELWATVNSPS